MNPSIKNYGQATELNNNRQPCYSIKLIQTELYYPFFRKRPN